VLRHALVQRDVPAMDTEDMGPGPTPACVCVCMCVCVCLCV
jgi:hypothetical protein